jgi:hypothetical protein
MGTTDEFFRAEGPDDISGGPAACGFEARSMRAPTTEGPFTAVFEVGVGGIGTKVGAEGRAGAFVPEDGPPNNNVFSGSAGVSGTSLDFPGAAGRSLHNIGVYGQTERVGAVPNLIAGVFGAGNLRPGVVGSSSQGFGVQGASFLTTGVRGTSFRGPGASGQSFAASGVSGQSSAASGVSGVSGTFGPTVPNTTNIAGVVGTSDQQHGVIGTSNASVGVIGFSNNIGVLGFTTTPGATAGFFIGNVQVTGTKAAVVPFPDGTHRALYCMESPDLWFEDFGEAKLVQGRAVVKLDPDFAKVIKTGDYHVFLAPEGDCRGLYVRRKTAVSFEVRELGGGKSSVAFSYRIVGRRKDIKGHKRFAKIDTRLPLPAAAARAPRKGAPTSRELRAFIAGLEKEAGEPSR